MSKVNNKVKDNTEDHADVNLLLETLQLMFTTMSDERDDLNELTHVLSGLQGMMTGVLVLSTCVLPRRKKEVLFIGNTIMTCMEIVQYHLTTGVHETDNPLIHTPTRMQ